MHQINAGHSFSMEFSMEPHFFVGDVVTHVTTGNRGTVKAVHSAGTSWIYCVHPLDLEVEGPDGFHESELILVTSATGCNHVRQTLTATPKPRLLYQVEPTQTPSNPRTNEFSAAYFDASSAAWHANKRVLTDGMGGRVGLTYTADAFDSSRAPVTAVVSLLPSTERGGRLCAAASSEMDDAEWSIFTCFSVSTPRPGFDGWNSVINP